MGMMLAGDEIDALSKANNNSSFILKRLLTIRLPELQYFKTKDVSQSTCDLN